MKNNFNFFYSNNCVKAITQLLKHPAQKTGWMLKTICSVMHLQFSKTF